MYRKKPVVINAHRWNGPEPIQRPTWFNEAWHETVLPNYDGSLTIKTLEGYIRADIGDWVIRGVAGELYPCKPDIFEQTYEEAE